jgi:hypothetical protein
VVTSAHFLWVRHPPLFVLTPFKLTCVQDIISKNTKPATGLCYILDGQLIARREISLSLTDINSHRMMAVLQCCAISHARRWGDTYTSTPVTVNHMMILKSYISKRDLSRTPTERRTGSHTTFTGAAWVSSIQVSSFWVILLMRLLGFKGN